MGRAVRTDRYRLVQWKEVLGEDGSAVYELYDYESDPGEKRNWATAKPAVVADLLAILRQHPEAKPRVER